MIYNIFRKSSKKASTRAPLVLAFFKIQNLYNPPARTGDK